MAGVRPRIGWLLFLPVPSPLLPRLLILLLFSCRSTSVAFWSPRFTCPLLRRTITLEALTPRSVSSSSVDSRGRPYARRGRLPR